METGWTDGGATIAFVAGVVGLGLSLCLLPRRSLAGLSAAAAFACLAAAGGAAAQGHGAADVLLAVTVAAFAAAALATLVRMRRQDVALARAATDVEVLRRDVARLGHARAALEAEAADLRSGVAAHAAGAASVQQASAPGTDAPVRELQERIGALEEARRTQESRARRLEDANRRLAEVAGRSERYLTAVTHELRTPLTSIRSFAEILLDHPDTDPHERREFLEIVRKESVRLTRLVNHVLDLARIEAGATRLTFAEFDAREVVAEVVASMRAAAQESGVSVVEAAPGEPRPLRADRDLVHQLLTNLVGNAVKFSPRGSRVTVRLTQGEAPGRVRFEVADQGPGIPPGDLERIFDRFHRLEDGRRVVGTGLGLSLCREIVQLHGGRVWAESEPNRGSTLCAEFPSVEETRAGSAAAAPATLVSA